MMGCCAFFVVLLLVGCERLEDMEDKDFIEDDRVLAYVLRG